MAIESRSILKTFFETGDIPTQDQFEDVIDSYIHQSDDNVTIYLPPGLSEKRFGIGNTTPEAPLGIKATGSTEMVAAFNKSDEEDALWFFNLNHGAETNPGFSISQETEVGLLSRFFIQESDGFVGLGTIEPNEKLHVQASTGDGVTGIRILNTATAANQGFGLGHEQNDDDQINGAFSVYEGAFTQNNKRLTILPGGNTGINILVPDTKLHISRSVATPATSLDLIEGTGIVTIGPMTKNLVFDYRGLQARQGEYVSDELILTADQLNLQRLGGSILIHGDSDIEPTDKAIITADARLGLGKLEPVERIDIDGAIRIGDAYGANNGTIRYTGTDFQGRVDDEWVSMTGGPPPPVDVFWEAGVDDAIYYKTGETTRVGIGKTDPSTTLDIFCSEAIDAGFAYAMQITNTSTVVDSGVRAALSLATFTPWNGTNVGLLVGTVEGESHPQRNLAAILDGNVLIGDVSSNHMGLNAQRVLGIQNGTAPSYSPSVIQIYSADLEDIPTFHVLRSNGDLVKLYTEEGLTITDDATISTTTYGADEAAVIENLRTRLLELEERLMNIGLLNAPV